MDPLSNDDVQSLSHPDKFYFESAQGWLMLGDSKEASAELQQISLPLQKHPDVLELRWLISAQAQDWTGCLEVARDLIARAPSRPFGWIHQAYALRRIPGGGLRAAWDALLPAAAQFPKEVTILYNLSCYACQMGELAEARKLLKLAFDAAMKEGNKETIRSMSLEDSDLKPLWTEISSW